MQLETFTWTHLGGNNKKVTTMTDKLKAEKTKAVEGGYEEEYLSAAAHGQTLYIEVAPGSSITSTTTYDGWVSLKIQGEVTHVSDVPSPDTAVSSKVFLEDPDLESQGDSYVNDPKEDAYR